MAVGKRSFMGHIAHISTGLLRFLNLVVFAGAIGSIILLLIIKHNPSSPAWGFLALGITTAVSGLFGAIASGQEACFSCHFLFVLLSSCGLCASFLVIFLRETVVLDGIGYDIARSTARSLLKAEGALFFVLFCGQMVILLLACLVQQCGFIDYYEDLEAQQPNPKQIAREQAAADKRNAKMEARSSHKLAEKMKQKYGAYNSDPVYSTELGKA